MSLSYTTPTTAGTQVRRRAAAAGLPKEAQTKEALWAFFVRECAANVHVLLCFSPVGAFHARLRRFPALVNCTTLDW
jgi:dynein heavy chain